MSEETGADYESLGMQVEDLRSVFNQANEMGEAYAKIFDEFIEENELGFALHVLCDYLLQPEAPAVNAAQLEKIFELHGMMNIEDDSLDMLRAKKFPASNP